MDISELRDLALSYKCATEEIKWESHLCFCVDAKIFIITSPDEVPVSASFKVSPEDFQYLSSKNGFRQAPHFAKGQWIMVENIQLLSPKQWETYLAKSYQLVLDKLSKKEQKEILES